MTTRAKRIAVIGAGPIGLEAALFAVQAGFDVQLYERGRVTENVGHWGHVKLFSPFGMNASQWGRAALSDDASTEPLPSDDTLMTGREFAERYLLPLSRLPVLAGSIYEQVSVQGIGRKHTWKGDLIGRPERADDPFQLLLSDADRQRTVDADYVLDCSGTFGNHNWAGAGGMPCVGEQETLEDADYLLPDILGSARARFVGKKTLVIGSGYSAATAIVALAKLDESEPSTQIIWLTRSDRSPPITPIENDSLPERARLSGIANRLAMTACSAVEWKPARLIRRITPTTQRRYTVLLEPRALTNGISFAELKPEEVTVDRIIANVGYRPDRRLYEELQFHECYASQGPIKLAAALLGETSADCTTQSAHGPETLRNPEPNLFILGSKSYGRDSRFLIHIGLQQIEDVFSLIGQSTVV